MKTFLTIIAVIVFLVFLITLYKRKKQQKGNSSYEKIRREVEILRRIRKNVKGPESVDIYDAY